MEKLQAHYEETKDLHLKDLFAANAQRFDEFSVKWNEFLFDYSKNQINQKTIDLLVELAEECQLQDAIDSMFAGEHINQTEDRARCTLHYATKARKS